MSKLTYLEAITHVRKYSDCYSKDAIAKRVGMNRDFFRHVVGQYGGAKELPEKYRSDFTNIVQMLVSVEQIDEAQTEAKQLDQVFRNSDPDPF